MNLFVIHTVQLVAKVVHAQREQNLVNVVCLQSEHQNMMSRKYWVAFLHNIESKQDLSNLFANFIRKSYLRDISNVPVVIFNNMETWFVTDQLVEKLFESNHEEANTRMVLHAL